MCTDKVNQSHFKEINEHIYIYKYTQQIETFKDKVYTSLLKSIYENKTKRKRSIMLNITQLHYIQVTPLFVIFG